MDWTAKLLDPKLIRITQDRTAAGNNDQVHYNLRCQKPLVDFDVTAVGPLTLDVDLPYAGEYTVTRRIRDERAVPEVPLPGAAILVRTTEPETMGPELVAAVRSPPAL